MNRNCIAPAARLAARGDDAAKLQKIFCRAYVSVTDSHT